MDQKTIYDRLIKLQEELSRLSNTVYAMQQTDIERYPKNYCNLSLEAAYRAEEIALYSRNLVISSGTPVAVCHRMVYNAHKIHIQPEDGAVTITLPGLLPKRKSKVNSSFLADPLFAALSEYVKNKELPKFTECVVCFVHVYDRTLPERRFRDYDNIELKHILDTVAVYLMVDDSGMLCDVYNTSELGKSDQTQITIMVKDAFPKWLETHQKSLDCMSEF